MRNSILLFTLAALPVASTQAADLFVSSVGGGSTCTVEQPCSSLQAAIDLAAASDRIYVKAGSYVENITIPAGKDGLSILGDGAKRTQLISDGGDSPVKYAPAGVPADIIVDIFSPNVTIEGFTIRHPEGVPTKRDIAVFVRPPALNASIEHNSIERLRTGTVLEPTAPGSRGLLVVQATGAEISKNRLSGNYQDQIHLPTSAAEVMGNQITGATRFGIVIIQETPDTLSRDNIIANNSVTASGRDGIQVQGDANSISKNKVTGNAGAGIRLCGPTSVPECAAPGTTATASDNIVTRNKNLKGNVEGAVLDYGVDNIVQQPGL